MIHALDSDPILAAVPVIAGFKVLDPCVLIDKIGEGGMGAVFRARHLNLNIDCAVKCLKVGMQSDAEFVARFRREAELAASISATNLVRVHDVRDAFGLHYIVMEFVDGESADARVQRKGPLPVDESCAIALDAARGLAAAHAAGVIHRDIKPGNILISKAGGVKLTDLGLAKSQEPQVSLMTQPSAVMGTPQYMPPEQFESAAKVTFASDVYSLGAALMFLLAGRHAITGGSMTEIIKQVCVGGFPDPVRLRDDLPAPVARLIRKATALSAAERFPDGAALAHELDTCLREMGGPPTLVDAQAGRPWTHRDSAAYPSKPNIDSIRRALRSGITTPPDPVSSDAATIAASASAAAAPLQVDTPTMPSRGAFTPPSSAALPEPPRPAHRMQPVLIAVIAITLIAVVAGACWIAIYNNPAPVTTQPSGQVPVTPAPATTQPAGQVPVSPAPATAPSTSPTTSTAPAATSPAESDPEDAEDESAVGRRLRTLAERGNWREALMRVRRLREQRRIPPERSLRVSDELLEILVRQVPENQFTKESERLDAMHRDGEPVLRNLSRSGSAQAALILAEAHSWYDAEDRLQLEVPPMEWHLWARAAADAGLAPGGDPRLLNAAVLVGDALVATEKFAAAAEQFRRAHAAGSADAAAGLAELYLSKYTALSNFNPVPSDWTRKPDDWAFELATKSAEAGSARGQAILAAFLEFGIGTPQDAALANEFYVKAARQGLPRAMKVCDNRKLPYR